MQEDFFTKGFLKDMRASLTTNINTLIALCRTNHVPIIWVRQEYAKDLSDAFLEMQANNIQITIADTLGCKLLTELNQKDSDIEIIKKRYSPFFQTHLEEHLRSIGTTDILLAGVNTHACIRMAAIDAYQRDFNVTIPIECVASNDHRHHEITLEYLNDHVANVTQLSGLSITL